MSRDFCWGRFVSRLCDSWSGHAETFAQCVLALSTILNAVVMVANYRHTSTRRWATGKHEVTLCHQEFLEGWQKSNGLNSCSLNILISHPLHLKGLYWFSRNQLRVCLKLVTLLVFWWDCRAFSWALHAVLTFLRSVGAGVEGCQQMCWWSDWLISVFY